MRSTSMNSYVICRENPATRREDFVLPPGPDGEVHPTGQRALALTFATAREAYAWAYATSGRRRRLQWWKVGVR